MVEKPLGRALEVIITVVTLVVVLTALGDRMSDIFNATKLITSAFATADLGDTSASTLAHAFAPLAALVIVGGVIGLVVYAIYTKRD